MASVTTSLNRKPDSSITQLNRALIESAVIIEECENGDEKLQAEHCIFCVLGGGPDSLGKLEICWVDSITSHLELDVARKKLFLFRHPSFVRLQATTGSLLPLYVPPN